MDQKHIKRGQHLYIAEATLEYLISILMAGSYLATLTKELGFSDSLTGILSSVVSLGCLFQLLSIFLRRRTVKTFVVTMSVINQLLFLLLYAVPLFPLTGKAKTIIFIVFIFTAYLLYYFAHPKKMNWFMSLVDDSYRGRFTANKEIVSLIAGMLFSYGMGALIDHYTALGQTRTAFLLSALVIFVLMVLHTASMIFTPEIPLQETSKKNLGDSIRQVAQNKNIRRISLIFILYYIAKDVSVPFYGVYQISELGLGLGLVSLLTMVGSVTRILVSRRWGRYADKTSFLCMLEKCLAVLILSHVCMVFAVPANGIVMVVLYNIFHGIAWGGINSAMTNLVFDHVDADKRADSLAICQATSGVAGFLATLAISPLVSHIQNNGNRFLVLPLYAQQVISVLSVLLLLVTLVVIRKMPPSKKA